MNPSRRSFLSALVAAPIAAPAIMAEAASIAKGGWISGAAGPLYTYSDEPSYDIVHFKGPTVGDHVETITFKMESGSTSETLAKLEHLFKEQAVSNMTIGSAFPNSSDIGAPHVPAADPVPFATDECRCPACQAMPPIQAITDAPSLVPTCDAGCGAPPCPVHSAPSIAWTMENAPLATYTPVTVRASTAPTPMPRVVLRKLTDDEKKRRAALLAVAAAPRRIIALTGLAGSGKTTAAKHLVIGHGWHRVRFAGPLKAMMKALGLSYREIDGDLKEAPCALLGGKTPRHAMQTLGTEWGRDLITPDLWIRAWRAVLSAVPPGVNVVVDDCRFPNEAEAVRAAGGVIVRVEREGAGQGAAGHSSEGYRVETGPVLTNNGTEQDFLCAVDDLITPL